jgi:hypothetical protein
MPVTLSDITRASGAAVLSDVEKLYVRTPVLAYESSVSVPAAATIATALAELEAAADAVARRQSLRAHIAAYKRGMTEIDGGSRAAHYDPRKERWSIRNGVRLLLGFDAEPEPRAAGVANFGVLTIDVTETPCWETEP